MLFMRPPGMPVFRLLAGYLAKRNAEGQTYAFGRYLQS